MRSLRLKILSGFGIILLLVVILSAIVITDSSSATSLSHIAEELQGLVGKFNV